MNLIKLQKQGFKYICGVDEAGRGPLAGPMSFSFFVVTIIQYKEIMNPLLKIGLHDSKQLSEKKREEIFGAIKKLGDKVQFKNSMISEKLIDKLGISRCVKILLKRLLRRIDHTNKTYFLVDGSIKFPKEFIHKVIIRGDSIEPVIMAASVISKVKRDRRMVKLAEKFPKYGFEIHKGYGTSSHIKAIKKYGLSEIHRRSFCKNLKTRN